MSSNRFLASYIWIQDAASGKFTEVFAIATNPMETSMKLATFTAALTLAASGTLAGSAGYRALTFDLPHHGHTTEGAIFYPGTGGTEITLAENPVFRGISVAEGAVMAKGQHPLILLSHGMGGGVRPMAWLASGLAERGAIVVALNHPNTTWSDFDMADGVKHWTRAQDISQALDTVLADPDLSDHIDKTRIMAAGFSYGGWTALSLGGIRGNHAGIVEACRTHGAALVYCDRFLSDEIDLPGIDPAPWNASYRDSRITHVAAIDPGFVWGLTEGETADPADNMLIIGLGAGEDRMLATDFDQSSFTTLVPRARIEHLAPAIHFTAMPLCKPAGAAILREENDDPVCTDPAGTDRAAVHVRIIDLLARDIGL